MRNSRASCSWSSNGSGMRRRRSASSAAAAIAGARSRARATGSGRLTSFIGTPRAHRAKPLRRGARLLSIDCGISCNLEVSMTPFDLSGRVAVVTGGNGGIGLGMARGLAAAGATVVLAARNAEKGEVAVASLTASGAKSAFIAFDVADEGSCRAMIGETVGRFGRLDILVNNAGTSIRKPPESYTAAQ